MTAENKLDNIVYCIRKSVGVHAIKSLRKNQSLSQKDIANLLGVSQALVSKWESPPPEPLYIGVDASYRDAPTMEQLGDLCALFDTSLSQLLAVVVAAEREQSLLLSGDKLDTIAYLACVGGSAPTLDLAAEPTDPKGDDHFELINKLRQSVYLGFFLSDVEEGEERPTLEHFLLETGVPSKSGSVPAFMRVVGKAENGYRCNIVSPPNQEHLYIYMRQDNAKNDRAIIVFSRDVDIQGMYQCGSGMMLSTYRKTGAKRVQWIVIVRIGDNRNELTKNCEEERRMPSVQRGLLEKSDIINAADTVFVGAKAIKASDEVIRPVLEEALPVADGWHLDFDCLHERQEVLYKDVCREGMLSDELGKVWTRMCDGT